jgi:inhibitor of the pro-sigma K processing machinery
MHRMIASVLVIFFMNVIGGLIGFHLPINVMTVGVTTVLSGYGLASLVLMKSIVF